MTDRRENAAKARAELEEAKRDLPGPAEGESGGVDLSAGSQSDRSDSGSGVGGFTAISDTQQAEVNELFRLIQSEGYMTEGMYSVNSDGEGNAVVSLSVVLPSSPRTPKPSETQQ